MKNLRHLRGRMTLAELAEKANHLLPEIPPFELTAFYISDLEQGRNKKPNGLALLRLAAALECKPEDLYAPPGTPPTKVATVAA